MQKKNAIFHPRWRSAATWVEPGMETAVWLLLVILNRMADTNHRRFGGFVTPPSPGCQSYEINCIFSNYVKQLTPKGSHDSIPSYSISSRTVPRKTTGGQQAIRRFTFIFFFPSSSRKALFSGITVWLLPHISRKLLRGVHLISLW